MRFTITQGPKNWEILQQKDGYAAVSLRGVLEVDDTFTEEGTIALRVVREESHECVIPYTMCSRAGADISASVTLPVGGLYRMEFFYDRHPELPVTSLPRAAAIHHIGVGDNWLIAGQSNASGVGYGQIEEPLDPYVHVLRDGEYWDMATTPLHFIQDLHSPWLAFAQKLHRELGYPIGLIPSAIAGSQICRWLPEEEGSLYARMASMLHDHDISVRGVVWYQGCSEAMEHTAGTYAERLASFVRQVRTETGDPHLPFVTVQIDSRIDGPDTEEEDRQWTALRDAQVRAAAAIEEMTLVPSMGVLFSDGIHHSAEGGHLLGERVARQTLFAVYGRGMDCTPPALTSAVRLTDTTVLLSFSHVVNGLQLFGLDAARIPLFFEDEKGPNAVASFSGGYDNITVTLTRPMETHPVVSLHYGHDLPYVIRDLGRQLPVLSVYQMPILG